MFAAAGEPNVPYTPGRLGEAALPPIQAHSLGVVDCAAELKQTAKKASSERAPKMARVPNVLI